MEYTFGNIRMVDGETLMRTASCHVMNTGTAPLDELLSPDYSSNPKTPQERQLAARKGGIMPGFLHVLAGPAPFLANMLMRMAVMALLPRVDGGAGASRVLYAELENYFDPYKISQFARERSMTPSGALDRIDIARGFNWDQAVEIVGKTLPGRVIPGSVVLVAGLTSQMDMAQQSSFEGLREMLNGITRCQQAMPVYLVATCPIADGSTYKPRGGHMLYHHAGAIVSIPAPRETKAGSRVTEWVLLRHVSYPERTMKIWDHAPAPARAARRRGGKRTRSADLSTFRTLDDFTAGAKPQQESRRP